MNAWRPVSAADVARRRAALLAQVRRFFDNRGVLEVDVPCLTAAPVSDPNIDSLAVNGAIARQRPLFLATSPEYAMKRMLAAGYPDIYAIARVFRDGESGRRHEPEFTLIEWYRLGFSLDAIIEEAVSLIATLLDEPGLRNSVNRRTYSAAFRDALDIDPLDASTAALSAVAGADDELSNAIGDRRDAWLDLLLSTHVAARFPTDRLTVVTHYPATQAALARLDHDDPRVALRFEAFLGDVELANGYLELTDADEQRARFDADLTQRRRDGRPAGPLDHALLDALDAGLPECAGVAVGFERVHMLADGHASLRDVLTFSLRETT